MSSSAPALHTGYMPNGATTFITGAAGFIGTEPVNLLVARGHQVVGLAESVEAAAHADGPVPPLSWATLRIQLSRARSGIEQILGAIDE